MDNTESEFPKIEFEGRLLPTGIASLEIAASFLSDELSDEARNCAMSFHYNLDQSKSEKGFALFDQFKELRTHIFQNREILLQEIALTSPPIDPETRFDQWLNACDVLTGIVRSDLNQSYTWRQV